MKANTGNFYEKKRSDIGNRRIAAGKKGIFSDTIPIGPGSADTQDFSSIKMNGVDGVCNGFIYCKGPHDITFHVYLRISMDGTVTKPEVRLNVGETFDLGMFNGRVYKIQTLNTNGSSSTDYTIVGE